MNNRMLGILLIVAVVADGAYLEHVNSKLRVHDALIEKIADNTSLQQATYDQLAAKIKTLESERRSDPIFVPGDSVDPCITPGCGLRITNMTDVHPVGLLPTNHPAILRERVGL